MKCDWNYLFFRKTWFKFLLFGNSWFAILRSFDVYMNADFGLFMTHERRVEFVMIRELSCFAWLNFQFFYSSSECVPSFSAIVMVTFWTDKPFVTYFVAFMILTDMTCNAEIKFLCFYLFPTPHSKQGSPRFMSECENVLVNSRDAWNGQIFLHDSILQRGN